MKRYLVFPLDFDTRAHLLEEPSEKWDELPRKLHLENRESLLKVLEHELGPADFDEKVVNFKDAGAAPFSIVAHHNILFHQVRYAFIQGYYYPSLVASCALGERILNHLILDLRHAFKRSPTYKKVYAKESFDDWDFCIEVLDEWGVFQVAKVADSFRSLARMRHNAIHFNPATVQNLRDRALDALRLLARIVGSQFGFLGKQRWMLPGTAGAFFIKKDCESDPFLQFYYLPQCPHVGPYYAMARSEGRWVVLDREQYDSGEVSDEEFATLHSTRTPDMVVSSEFPPQPGVSIVHRW